VTRLARWSDFNLAAVWHAASSRQVAGSHGSDSMPWACFVVRQKAHGTGFVPWAFGCVKLFRVARPSSAHRGPDLFCNGESSPRAGSSRRRRIPACRNGHERIEAAAGFSALRLGADAGPLACGDLDGLSADGFARGAARQMGFGPLPEREKGHLGAGLAERPTAQIRCRGYALGVRPRSCRLEQGRCGGDDERVE